LTVVSTEYPATICPTSTKIGGSMYRSLTMFNSVCRFHDSRMAVL
jgi:hypothetical protein